MELPVEIQHLINILLDQIKSILILNEIDVINLKTEGYYLK